MHPTAPLYEHDRENQMNRCIGGHRCYAHKPRRLEKPSKGKKSFLSSKTRAFQFTFYLRTTMKRKNALQWYRFSSARVKPNRFVSIEIWEHTAITKWISTTPENALLKRQVDPNEFHARNKVLEKTSRFNDSWGGILHLYFAFVTSSSALLTRQDQMTCQRYNIWPDTEPLAIW